MTPFQTEGKELNQFPSENSVTQIVINTVADEIDVNPLDLPPLYNAIDPDALENLIESNGAEDVCVTFNYAGCQVVITGTGIVTVENRPEVERLRS